MKCMKSGSFVLGLILFLFGMGLLFIFDLLSGYIITLYPISGYLGLAVVLISFVLLYVGICSKSSRQEATPTAPCSTDNHTEDFEEWEGEDTFLY